MLHDDDGQALAIGHLQRTHNVVEGVLPRRGLDLQDPLEVLPLNVDDDQGSVRSGHAVPSLHSLMSWSESILGRVDDVP